MNSSFRVRESPTLQNFNASCLPDTVLTMTSPIDRIGASYGIPSGLTDEIVLAAGEFTVSKSQGLLGCVPSPMFDRIEDMILGVRGVERIRYLNEDRILFSNCNRGEILQQLSPITISLERQTGSFVFLPEDYMYFRESRNECWLRLIPATQDNGLFIDLLLIGGTNVRINGGAQSFQICDSNEEF